MEPIITSSIPSQLVLPVDPTLRQSQPILEPSNSLLERILHSVQVFFHTQIRPQCKTMVDASIEVDLERDFQVD